MVDNRAAAERLHEAAVAGGVTQRVLVDLDVGTRRTGVATPVNRRSNWRGRSTVCPISTCAAFRPTPAT